MSSEYTFPCVRGTRFSNFFRVSFTCEFTFHLSEVRGLVVSSGFHSAVSSVSPVSEVHGLVASSTSEFTFPSVRGAWFTGFLRVSFTREFTFPSSTRTQFSGFIRVSFTSECAFLSFRSALFTTFLRVSSPVSTLSHVLEVHVLVISLGFHSAVSSLFVCF